MAKIGDGRTVLTSRKKQTIFSQGDPADAVFYIQTGKVKLTVVSKQGKEAVVAMLEAGAFFGESCLIGQVVRLATATALEASSILRIAKETMLRMLSEEPSFSKFFTTYLLSHSMRIEEDLVDQLFNSSEKRLARALLLLARFGKEGEPQSCIPNISQETLAEMIGTTRSRVSFFMNKFRKLGFIEYNGTLNVHSSLLNIVLHD
ncbi:MAG TPA: Crp/Fnr family transcriptional regulator [Pyrinomonadaceae bacterium]|nr:Crp/Fnr family transcriptional regulator [Pyrinomonadaceae bacterium]